MTPDDDLPSTGLPDRQTLRLLEGILVDEPLVASTQFEPDSYEPRILRIQCEERRYPSTVESARFDIRWFASGDFSIHYVETSEMARWECRWDRHPNPHNARFHFHHPPPDGEITDLTWSSLHPIDVISTVVGAVEQRIERQWSTDD